MRLKPYNDNRPPVDYLGADARAVIEADFKEIQPLAAPRSLIEQIQERWAWIRRQRQRG